MAKPKWKDPEKKARLLMQLYRRRARDIVDDLDRHFPDAIQKVILKLAWEYVDERPKGYDMGRKNARKDSRSDSQE